MHVWMWYKMDVDDADDAIVVMITGDLARPILICFHVTCMLLFTMHVSISINNNNNYHSISLNADPLRHTSGCWRAGLL